MFQIFREDTDEISRRFNRKTCFFSDSPINREDPGTTEYCVEEGEHPHLIASGKRKRRQADVNPATVGKGKKSGRPLP